jgi:hypothetical protein
MFNLALDSGVLYDSLADIGPPHQMMDARGSGL